MNITVGQHVTIRDNSIYKDHFKLDSISGTVVSVTPYGAGIQCAETGRVESVALGDGSWAVDDEPSEVLVTPAGTLTEVDGTPVPRETHLVDVATAAGLAEAYAALVDAAGEPPPDTYASTTGAKLDLISQGLLDLVERNAKLDAMVERMAAEYTALAQHVQELEARLAKKPLTPPAAAAKAAPKLTPIQL